MILECPECSAKFKIPDGALGEAGREVRCGKCEHKWHAMPPSSPADPAAQDEENVDDTAAANQDEAPKAPDIDAVLAGKKHKAEPALDETLGDYKPPKTVKSKKLFWFSMILSYVVLAVIITGLWITKEAPEMWGFTNSSGFAFERIELEPVAQLGGERFTMNPLFKLGGTIRNTSGNPKVVPIIRVTLKDKDGNVVYRRQSKDQKSVPPGETVDFLMENLEQADPSHTHFVVEMGGELELILRSVEVEEEPEAIDKQDEQAPVENEPQAEEGTKPTGATEATTQTKGEAADETAKDETANASEEATSKPKAPVEEVIEAPADAASEAQNEEVGDAN